MDQVPWDVVAPLIAVLILAAIFREPISRRIAGSGEIKLKAGGLEIQLKGDEAKQTLQSLLDDMHVLVDRVPLADRRDIISRVESDEGRVRVVDLFPEFERNSVEHERLRLLREAQLIRPIKSQNSSRFQKDSILMIKPFGRLMLKHERAYILGA